MAERLFDSSDNFFEGIEVIFKGFSTCGTGLISGVWFAIEKLLLLLDIARVAQFFEVTGQIAVGDFFLGPVGTEGLFKLIVGHSFVDHQ